MATVSNINTRILEQAANDATSPVLSNFPKIDEWIEGKQLPTVKQLAGFAKAVKIPFGFFFLKEMPSLNTGIPLFRSFAKQPTENYSTELRDSIKQIQDRQEWLREYVISEGKEPLSYVGAFNINSTVQKVVDNVRKVLGIDESWASQIPTGGLALNYLIEKIEQAGIFVTINGVIGNNTHRPLNPDEFRGFVLVDKYAPYIFINGKDFLAAKLFTLAHELAHIWLGSSVADELKMLQPADNREEKLCDSIAAELLVPTNKLKEEWKKMAHLNHVVPNLSRIFKVSRIVIARRLLDIDVFTKEDFFKFYNNYLKEWNEKEGTKPSGGSFYNNQNYRVGKAFFTRILTATKQGKMLYSEAYKLTGLHGKTFHQYEQNQN